MLQGSPYRDKRYTLREDLTTLGQYSTPSKMPCRSWSLPTYACKTGRLLAKSSVTPCHECYAHERGMYVMPNVKDALNRRLNILNEAIPTMGRAAKPAKARVLEDAFVRSLTHYALHGQDHFRWFDSGDLQSYSHLALLARIAVRVPQVMFWLPTQERGILREFLKDHGAFPTNLVVRLSSSRINMVVGGIEGVPNSMVYTEDVKAEYRGLAKTWDGAAGGYMREPKPIDVPCPANLARGTDKYECGDCRMCWDSKIPIIGYEQH